VVRVVRVVRGKKFFNFFSLFKDCSLKPMKNGSLPLELVVQVYNINQGHNPEILQRSENLSGYSLLTGKISEYNKTLPIDESVKAAIKYCIEHDVLKEFLRKHGSEVVNMLFDDITIEEIGEIRYEEGREEGFEEGREKERSFVMNLLDQGLSVEEIKQRLTN